MRDGRCQANFTKGGLMVPESRIVADLLLKGVDAAGWKQAIEVDNVLAKRSRTTASTKAGLIRARLQTMTKRLWRLVRNGAWPPSLGPATDSSAPVWASSRRTMSGRWTGSCASRSWPWSVPAPISRRPTIPSWPWRNVSIGSTPRRPEACFAI
ncbi:MAG: BrxA family protein [Chromatiaceae bacterium]